MKSYLNIMFQKQEKMNFLIFLTDYLKNYNPYPLYFREVVSLKKLINGHIIYDRSGKCNNLKEEILKELCNKPYLTGLTSLSDCYSIDNESINQIKAQSVGESRKLKI